MWAMSQKAALAKSHPQPDTTLACLLLVFCSQLDKANNYLGRRQMVGWVFPSVVLLFE